MKAYHARVKSMFLWLFAETEYTETSRSLMFTNPKLSIISSTLAQDKSFLFPKTRRGIEDSWGESRRVCNSMDADGNVAGLEESTTNLRIAYRGQLIDSSAMWERKTRTRLHWRRCSNGTRLIETSLDLRHRIIVSTLCPLLPFYNSLQLLAWHLLKTQSRPRSIHWLAMSCYFPSSLRELGIRPMLIALGAEDVPTIL